MHIDEPINNITIAVVAEESSKICGSLGKVISLYIKPKIKLYSTAMAEASVAVKIPVTIPPITTTSIKRLGKASMNVLPTCLKLLRLPTLYFSFLPKKLPRSLKKARS